MSQEQCPTCGSKVRTDRGCKCGNGMARAYPAKRGCGECHNDWHTAPSAKVEERCPDCGSAKPSERWCSDTTPAHRHQYIQAPCVECRNDWHSAPSPTTPAEKVCPMCCKPVFQDVPAVEEASKPAEELLKVTAEKKARELAEAIARSVYGSTATSIILSDGVSIRNIESIIMSHLKPLWDAAEALMPFIWESNFSIEPPETEYEAIVIELRRALGKD
jgi:hypothetical protein